LINDDFEVGAGRLIMDMLEREIEQLEKKIILGSHLKSVDIGRTVQILREVQGYVKLLEIGVDATADAVLDLVQHIMSNVPEDRWPELVRSLSMDHEQDSN